MGYRSDVAAYFYATDKQKVDFIKIWLKENLPFDDWKEHNFEEKDDGYLFMIEDVKWYSSYSDVIRFESVAETFCTEFCHDADQMAAYEFVRIGEELADIESKTVGLDCQYKLNVTRSFYVDEN